VKQSMDSEGMDCRALACPEFIEGLSMNSPVIANAVKQSMTPDCMDCRASLAVTMSLFMVHMRYRAGFGRLTMRKSLFAVRERCRAETAGLQQQRFIT